MISISHETEIIRVTVSGDFIFSVAQELIIRCKHLAMQHKVSRIEMTLEKVEVFHSCAIGAILLLSEHLNGNMHISLNNCGPIVYQVFNSGLLGNFSGGNYSVTGATPSDCRNCFSNERQINVSGCVMLDNKSC